MIRVVSPSPRKTFHLPIALIPSHDLGAGLACPSCALALDLHQPDSRDPDSLLATCPACGAWHLIAKALDQDGVVIVTVPGGDAVRAAIKGVV